MHGSNGIVYQKSLLGFRSWKNENMYRARFAKSRVAAGLALALFTMIQSVSFAQNDSPGPRYVNLQGEDIELPEDFLVRVDGNKLQVALVSLGAIERQYSTSNLLVSLLNSNGDEKTATTNQQGIAEFTGVQPDELHALLVVDEKLHAAIPLMTVSAQSAMKRNINSKRIRLPLAPANREEILSSIARGTLPEGNMAGELYKSSDYRLRAVNPYSVRLQNNGNLLGRVVVSDRDLADNLRFANLTFLRNNQVIARTDSDPDDGSFNVSGLREGVYGVIAAGPAGYSSFAFEVLPALSVTAAIVGDDVPGRPVSIVQPIPDPNQKLYVFLCPPKLVPKISDRVRQAYGQPTGDSAGNQPVPGLTMAGSGGGAGFGGGGGGFGGGSAGGGGFGGAGGLLGLAGLGAGIAALITVEDNNNNTPVVSPISSSN